MKEKKAAQNAAGKRLTKKQILLIVLCSVLALLLAVLIAGTAYMEHMLGLINRNDPVETLSQEEYEQFLADQTEETLDPTFTGPTLNAEDVTWAEDVEPIEDGEHIINIMLVGQDRRPGEGRARSDAMILCTVNTETGSVTMTSFMRDMYVQIPGYGGNKINASYQIGGMDLLAKCIEKNFGVIVDGTVEVDFSGFVDVIDLIGGIDIELTKAEANHINARPNLGNATGEVWNLKEGVNHLNGNQALAYSRVRYIGNSDFDRTGRQRAVIDAVMQTCKSMNLTQLNGLLKSALPMVTTDMTNAQILNYALDIFPTLLNLKISSQRIPADGDFQYARVDNLDVLVVDFEASSELLKVAMDD